VRSYASGIQALHKFLEVSTISSIKLMILFTQIGRARVVAWQSKFNAPFVCPRDLVSKLGIEKIA
jgi:hypothetical protein